MFTSFSTALSALDATSVALDVVSNNLANMNTTGYKASTASFHELMSQSLDTGLGNTPVGFGVGAPVTLRQFTQGVIQSTSGPLDGAIQGDGFFLVKNSEGSTLYTRGGNFEVDKSGALMTATGEKLQGWTNANVTGTLDTNLPVGNIVLPSGTLTAPTATQNMSLDLNLDASTAPGATFSTTVEAYDSLGNSHMLNFTFTKGTANNQWTYSAAVPATDLTTAMTPITGTLTFDTQGKLTSPAPGDAVPQIAVTGLADGAADMNINWDVWNGTASRLTQFSQPSAVSSNAQDGAAAASLVRIGLADGGKLVATYSNGNQSIVGQLALAVVRNPQSLIAVGNNNYGLSADSALPAVGIPGTGGRGGVLGGAVEASTVDITKEFTNLIVLQRAYQANAKVITTVDQMTQDTISLKQ